jgi:hypothetical protein
MDFWPSPEGGGDLEDSPSSPPEGSHSANTLISDFQHPELWEDKFLLLKALSFWFFAVLEN